VPEGRYQRVGPSLAASGSGLGPGSVPAQGIELVGSTPEAFAAYVKAQLTNWTRMLTEMGLRDAPLPR